MSVLDSAVLRTHWLLRRKPSKVVFSRVDNVRQHLERVESTISEKSIGIYVHIPYCRAICMFCPYFRVVLKSREELSTYLDAVLSELELYGRALRDLGLNVVEIHVGGGTPSLAPPAFYKRLLESLSEFFNVKTGIGIEVNPEDFRDYKLVEEYYASGVDEVSIGVQSFNERVLKSLSRKHSPRDNVLAVENSVKAGFKWINVDLMFLTPSIKGYIEMSFEEKLKAFRRDLEESLELGVHQITFYSTIIPKQSSGYKLVELKKLSQEVDLIDQFVEEVLNFAEEYKLHLTRVYSLSKKPYEYATVNLEMIGPLVGLGASAWSNTGLYQYVNVHSVPEYTRLLREGRVPVVYARSLSASSRVWRLFFDQLSSGVIREDVFRSLKLKIPLELKLLVKLMELSGLLERTSSGYKLTKRGVVEVYKSVINYVVEIPVKLTGVLASLDPNRVPDEITV
jgi:oxygen-independent coproporphyrinogen-3 oxidase